MDIIVILFYKRREYFTSVYLPFLAANKYVWLVCHIMVKLL